MNILIISLLALNTLFAGTDGTIRGAVRDVNGEGLPAVQVYIEELGQGATTDIDGNYIILNVQVGTYEVKAAMIGYATQVFQNVSVTMDQTQWLNIVMQEEAIEGEEIVVSGEKKLVEAGTTSKKITVNQEAIEALPIKDVSELYSLQSGVVKIESGMRGAIPAHEERGLEEVHVRGGRTGEIAYMIDGMYIRNPIYGGKGSGTRLNIFAIEEFDWQPGGFNAEYGDAMSAVSNLHTAKGKDKFRYKFKYETSLIGDKVFDNEYDRLRGYNDYNLGFGGKVPFLDRIPKVNGVYYWVSGQYTDNQAYRVLEFDDNVYVDTLATTENMKNLTTPWDTNAGFVPYGFDNTWDVFGKLTINTFNNKLRFNYSYWQVANHRQSFNTRYIYWDQGRQEIFKDTYRHTIELNHTISDKTFYTLRYSHFIQDQFMGVRWRDSDDDGFPDWFEYSNAAGNPTNDYVEDMTSNPNDENVLPFLPNDQVETTQILYTKRDGNGPDDWTSGWYYGATPGNYSWDYADGFIDVNGDGIYTEYYDENGNGQRDPGEHYIDAFLEEHYVDFNSNGVYDEGEDYIDANGNQKWDSFDDHDKNGDGVWDGPVMLEEAVYRDGDYWLTPEMYVDYEPFYDEAVFWNEIQQDPYYGYVSQYQSSNWWGEYFDGWNEGRAFGGSDAFYGTSRALTNEVRLDVTTQATDKWRTRVGFDLKSHKLNFYEIVEPWLDGLASRQRFAEYWEDVGRDGISYLDNADGNYAWDEGEGNGTWDFFYDANDDGKCIPADGDQCEPFSDFNENEQWNDYVEPVEFAAYWQNTFEVPWMVINAGIRLDGVNYKTQVWSDQYGNYSPYKPWMWRDCGADGLCPDDGILYNGKDIGEDDGEWQSNEEVTDEIGLSYTEVFFEPAKWLWKISPRLGFSHVITDQATFTFNYGLYYQTPVYENVYRNTNRADDPQETFEESEAAIGNATMTASRTQSYEFGFNVQVNRNWAFSIMGWVKDMDQLVSAKTYRSGIYTYQVAANGDYGQAQGIDFTLQNRGMLINTMLQYTYSVARANGDYDAAAFGQQYVDAPSQQYLMSFDRPHDLALSLYSFLPFGVNVSMTHFYQSGFPYTRLLLEGDTLEEDLLNKNGMRSSDWYWANMSFSKNIEFSNFKVGLGLSIYNLFNNRNEVDIYPMTGVVESCPSEIPDCSDDQMIPNPGEYYEDEIGLDGEYSGGYYDRPWMFTSPREFNFFIRLDFN